MHNTFSQQPPDAHRNELTYDFSQSGEESGSPAADTESKSDNGIKPASGPELHPSLASRMPKVRLNSVAEESSHTLQPSDGYHSSSLSTISSVTGSSNGPHDEAFASASPEAHLSKLKSIHRKVKRRKRIRRVRRVVHFIITKILVPILLTSSLVLLLCGYFLSVHYLLVSGCIILLAAVGFQVQLCFTERTGPNKFNPMSVPFSIPAEDLKQMDAEAPPVGTEKPTFCAPQIVREGDFSPTVTQSEFPQPMPSQHQQQQQQQQPQQTPLPPGISDVQVKRLSLALARVANSALQVPRYPETESGGVLRLARRLTMASSAIGIGSHDPVFTGSSWLTGSQIRHGVRRSLAWNATGASRFYERNYD